MIKYITVTNYLGESLVLDLAHPEQSGFAVESIDGLTPGKSTINTTEITTSDGAIVTSARLTSRNIVMNLKFLWNPTIEATRHNSYKYFPIKKKISLIFETDTRLCQIDGYVESNEPTIFAKAERTSISIICPTPMFYLAGDLSTKSTLFSSNNPNFTLPFANTFGTNSLILSSIIAGDQRVVDYDGDSNIGILIKITVVAPVENISIFNIVTRESMTIDTDKLLALTGHGAITGDYIEINTERGSKSIKLIRAGVTINILNCLAKDTDWFQLSKGENVFAYTVDSGDNNIRMIIENKTFYEGL